MKKTAIITGASRGIGYAAAKKLGMDGCQEKKNVIKQQ